MAAEAAKGTYGFLDSSALHRASIGSGRERHYEYFFFLGEQFRTPSLESVTIHTVRPFLVGWLVGSLMKMWGSPPAMRKWPLKVSESSEEDANYVYAGSFAGCVFWQQGLLLHALKFLLLDLLLFGDKLLRNSGQLFKSKSTSLGVL